MRSSFRPPVGMGGRIGYGALFFVGGRDIYSEKRGEIKNYCSDVCVSDSDRPFYLNLQFLLAPVVGLIILICFVFEDICLADTHCK